MKNNTSEHTTEEHTTEEHSALEIYLSTDETPTVEDDGLLWKEVLRTGEWKFRPGAGQKPVEKPLRVVSGHVTNPAEELGFADIIDAFNDGAVDHVTIPTSHEDKPEQNTGFVKKLEIRDVDGSERLYAGMDFTEPDIKEKALRGTIANTSVGIVFDYIKKSTGNVYKQALGHVALTNKPWINGMTPFAASEHEIDSEEIGSVVIEPENEVLDSLKIENVADFDVAKELIIQKAKELGNLEWLPSDWQEVDANKESVNNDAPEEENKETEPMSDGTSEKDQKEQERLEAEKVASETALSETIDKKIEEATKASELALSEKEERIAKLESELRKKSVAEKIGSLKEEGFSEYPGLLKKIEELYLADEGSEVATLSLSEEVDGKTVTSEVKLSVSDIVTQVVESMPRNDDKRLDFGDQANEFQNHSERASESNPSEDPVAKAAALNERFGRPFPTAKEGN